MHYSWLSLALSALCFGYGTALQDAPTKEYLWSLQGKYGILIMDRPLKMNPSVFSNLWKNAAWRITIDGGTDVWFDFTKKHNLTLALPNQVTGNFARISPETLAHCRKLKGVEVIYTPDEDFTDFEKAAKILVSGNPDLDYYVAVGEFSSRLDETFSDLSSLSKVGMPGYLMTGDTLTWLLPPGTSRIPIPQELRDQRAPCGILPFHPATVSTSGLKWNLKNQRVELGGLISSSNTYDGSSEVMITTDNTTIWTMSMGGLYL